MAVTYDVTYGNVSQEEAQRLAFAVGDFDSHSAGDTEPQITALVCSLLKAHGGHTVLETGAFQGRTTRRLLAALEDLGGGHLHFAEIDEARRNAVWERIKEDKPDNVSVYPHGDIFQFISRCLDRTIDVAFIDDCHERAHVEREVQLLYPKMRPGGLMLFHDIDGVCSYIGDTVVKYGGVALTFPRLGPAGGLGIVQVR